MRRSLTSCPAGRQAAPSTPSASQTTIKPAPSAASAPAALTPSPWGRCPAHYLHQLAPWGSESWGLNQRPTKLAATAEVETAGGRGRDDSSSASGGSDGSDAGQLQPKPQARYRRLTMGRPGSAPSKPRRWHKVAYPAPPPPSGATEPVPVTHVAALQPHPGQGSPASHCSGNGSSSGSGHMAVHEREHAAASATGQDHQHHHQVKQQQPHQSARRRRPQGQEQRQQQQQQQRAKPPGGAPQSHEVSGRRGSSKTYGNDVGGIDDVDDEGEEDEGELLGLSEEELEELVFASARAGVGRTATKPTQSAAAEAVAAPSAGKQGRQQRAGSAAAATAAAASAAAAVAAAGLPSEVEVLVMAAVRSGSVSNDAVILADQVRKLCEAAAAAAVTVAVGNSGGNGSSATASATADTLRASVTAVADLLDCEAEAAAAVLVNYPRYVGVLFAGGGGGDRGGGGGGDGGLERLRSFAGMLKLDLVEARDIVRRNPALLLAPYEPLRQKLTALANATGLSLAQATAMVTTYMFPEL